MNPKATYWNNAGKHQALAKVLNKLIPVQGEVPDKKNNPALEEFRRAQNAYYDLYNNGGCNIGPQITAIFGPGLMKLARKGAWDACLEKTEPVIDRLIMEAVFEQASRGRLEIRHLRMIPEEMRHQQKETSDEVANR